MRNHVDKLRRDGGKDSTNGDRSYFCPVCNEPNFKVNQITGKWFAWGCDCSQSEEGKKEIREAVSPAKLSTPKSKREFIYTDKNGTELMMQALEPWEQGSRARQISRRVLKAFLQWAVLNGKLPVSFAPPAVIPEIRKEKRIGYALTDLQILSLIENERDDKWKYVYQLLGVYGLRPAELRNLRIQDGVNGKELWSIYRKSKGGTKGDKTEPRKLQALFVKDADGNPIDWKLQERIEIGEELPPLGDVNKELAGSSLRTRLKRKKLYQQIKEDAKKLGQECVPYSFRHRYAKASHSKGFPLTNIAESMGHTPEVHMQNYARFKPSGTKEMYKKANELAA